MYFAPANLSYVGHTSTPECVSRPGPGGTFAVSYYCLVFTTASGWGGRLDVVLAGALLGGTVPADYKVCRYTPSAFYYAANSNHPRTYCIEQLGVADNITPCYGRKVTNNLIIKIIGLKSTYLNCGLELNIMSARVTRISTKRSMLALV